MYGKLAFLGTNTGTPSFDFSVESQKNKSVIGASAIPGWMKHLASSVKEWLAIIPKVIFVNLNLLTLILFLLSPSFNLLSTLEYVGER